MFYVLCSCLFHAFIITYYLPRTGRDPASWLLLRLGTWGVRLGSCPVPQHCWSWHSTGGFTALEGVPLALKKWVVPILPGWVTRENEPVNGGRGSLFCVWLLTRRVGDNSVFAYTENCPHHCKHSLLSLSMLLIFCKRTIGDSSVRSLKNINSQPDIMGYQIRTEVSSIFGSTCFCNNNNNKSMQNMHNFYSNFVPIVYIQCILSTTK